MAPDASQPRGARWHTVAIVLLGVLGTALSCILFLQVRTFEQNSQQDEFRQRATAGATALQRRVQEHLEVLYSFGAVYTAAARPLTRTAFRELDQGRLQRYAGVQAVGWVPRLGETERETYVAAAR